MSEHDGRAASDEALPKVAVLLPTGRRHQILSREAERDLATIARVIAPETEDLHAEQLSGLLDGAVACLTGWGTPPLRPDLLASHPALRLVAHTAGSIRRLVPSDVLSRGLRVSSAASIIADAVAEFVVLQALLCLRESQHVDRAMRAGDNWEAIRERYTGRLLGNTTIGVISTGHVGRTVIRLLQPFGCRILAYDPFLTPSQANHLGVQPVALDELFRLSDVVTLHAPVLPETIGMIGAAQLARLRDGAVFINTARAALVDEAALLRELETGRFIAALDVFAEEPLPRQSRLRSLPNVILSPHIAGHTIDTHLRQGQAMVDEVRRWLRDEPLAYEVTAELFPILA